MEVSHTCHQFAIFPGISNAWFFFFFMFRITFYYKDL